MSSGSMEMGIRYCRTLQCKMQDRRHTSGKVTMAKSTKLPKDIQISVRCNSRFKNLLIELAAGENRSLSNMLEVAVQSYARAAGYEALGTETSGKPAKKK